MQFAGPGKSASGSDAARFGELLLLTESAKETAEQFHQFAKHQDQSGVEDEKV